MAQVQLRSCPPHLYITTDSTSTFSTEPNLLKLPQRFREEAPVLVGKRVLGKQGNIARVEPLGFVEVRLAPVPLALPPCHIGEQFRNPARIRPQRPGFFEVTHRRLVIP